MRQWLRTTAAETRQRALRQGLEDELAADDNDEGMGPQSTTQRRRRAEEEEEEEEGGSNHQSSSDDDEMPPLLGPDSPRMSALNTPPLPPAPSTATTATPSQSFFSFGTTRTRCKPDYSCCLRYSLHLGPCCMPRAATELVHLPSAEWLQARFLQLHADDSTLHFLRACDAHYFDEGWCSSWGLRVGILKPLLRKVWAHTDVNGWLGVGQMFLVSGEQVRLMLQRSIPKSLKGQSGVEWPWSMPTGAAAARASSSSSSSPLSRPKYRLLDIGAGDGHITSQLAHFFDEVVTTEVAPQMVKRLKARGYTCVHTGDLDEGLPVGGGSGSGSAATSEDIVGEGFDFITLFNVIDRCSKPRTLLRQILARMRKPREVNGELVNSSRLLLSVPLPLDPSVEVGTKWIDPEENLLVSPRPPRSYRDFESSACAMADALIALGFNIEVVSRVPYLSQGDTYRPFYVLEASLWMLSARQEDEPVPKQQIKKAVQAGHPGGSAGTSTSTGGHSHS